jgi:hypothetical protein
MSNSALMSKRRFAVMLATCLLLVSGAGLHAARLDQWTGLIHTDTVDALVGPHTVAEGDWPFTVGLLTGPNAYSAFAASANTVPVPADLEIDWRAELLVYAIWPRRSNDVLFESWTPATDGTGTLHLSWSGIIPLYFEHYPALVHTVDREELASVDFVLADAGVVADVSDLLLANVVVPEPSTLRLAVVSILLVGGWRRRHKPPARRNPACGRSPLI